MNTNNGNNDRDASKFWTYRDTGYSESIDEAFASIQDSHIELSQMADSKANILITVTSILLTLAVSEIGNGGLDRKSVV